HVRTGVDRPPLVVAREREQPGRADDVHVVRGDVAVWTVLTIRGDRAVDQVRPDRRQRLIVHAERCCYSGPVRLDHHIRRLNQAVEALPRLRGLQVQGEAALVAGETIVGVDAIAVTRARYHADDGVLLTRLVDADHIGAHIGQHARAEGARQQ